MAHKIIAGRYKLGKKLGQGGVGAVYKATDLETGHDVAVKLMTPEALAQDDDGLFQDLFEREPALAYLAGKGAVKPLDTGEDPKHGLFIVMELLSGTDLEKMQDKSRSGRLPPELVVPVIGEALKTMRQAHEHGVMHRDLKPANIFLTNDDQVKILDFGFGDTIKKPIMPPKDFVGTMAYAPPEQVQGKRTTPKSDVWSLGATAYTALSGELVPACPVPPIESVVDVPDYVAHAVNHMLACNPQRRPTDTQALQELSPGLRHMLAMQMEMPDKSMSTGAKLAVGVAIAGVLWGAYSIVSGVNEAISGTEPGRWWQALPSGGTAEVARLLKLGYIVTWPEFTPPPEDKETVEVTASVTGTTFVFPPGTKFWKIPPEKVKPAPAKTASGPGPVCDAIFVDEFGQQWAGIIKSDGSFDRLESVHQPVAGVLPGHVYRITGHQFDGTFSVLGDITLAIRQQHLFAEPPSPGTTDWSASSLVPGDRPETWGLGSPVEEATSEPADAEPEKKASGGVEIAIGTAFVALLATAGVAYFKVQELEHQLALKFITIVPPDINLGPGRTIADDATVRGVFSDVLGSTFGPKVLDYAMSNGWRYAQVPTAAKPAPAPAATPTPAAPPAQTAPAAVPKKASGPVDYRTDARGMSIEDVLWVDKDGKQWVGQLNPDGSFRTLEPAGRKAVGVVLGHAYKISPFRPDMSYDILADLGSFA